jgi:hypothetical protein
MTDSERRLVLTLTVDLEDGRTVSQTHTTVLTGPLTQGALALAAEHLAYWLRQEKNRG